VATERASQNAGSVTFAIVADRHFEDIRPSMEAARSGTSSESADRRLRARRERLQRRRYVRPTDKQGRSRSHSALVRENKRQARCCRYRRFPIGLT